MYTTIGTYYSFQMSDCCPGWMFPNRTTVSHIKRIIFVNTNCCINKFVPPDDKPRSVRNM
jgi:hypothetical protein